MNQTKKLQAFQNVIPTGTAIVDLLPTIGGNTLEAIWLNLGGTTLTKAMLTGWRLKANGKTIRESTGTNTNLRNLYYGITTAATVLLIDFMYAKGRTPNAFQSGALDLSANSGIKQLTLEVDIAGATAPLLTGWAEISPAGNIAGEERIRFVMMKTTRATVNIAAAGEFAIAVPHVRPEAGGSVFSNVQLFSANTTNLRIRRQGIDEFDIPVTLLQEAQKRAGRVPQAGHIVFDPCLDNILAGRVWDTTSRAPTDPVRPGAGVSSAEFLVTVSGAETFVVETEELIYLNDY
jgi:hypothetical protein